MGERMVVSVASVELFQQHCGVFDRPGENPFSRFIMFAELYFLKKINSHRSPFSVENDHILGHAFSTMIYKVKYLGVKNMQNL